MGDLKIGDIVNVYDRYRFAIPLRAEIIKFSSTNDGVEVVLLESNSHKYPIGDSVWAHGQQLKFIQRPVKEIKLKKMYLHAMKFEGVWSVLEKYYDEDDVFLKAMNDPKKYKRLDWSMIEVPDEPT